MPQFSLIITTYNRPDALALVLYALADQSIHNFEVIIADDGSCELTLQLIQQLKKTLPYQIHHVWQADIGFRAARSRNQAVKKAQGNYLIFMDGDCIPRVDFIDKHLLLAEKGYFIAGNRVLLDEKFSHFLCSKLNMELILDGISQEALAVWKWSYFQWFKSYLQGHVNRFIALFYLPIHRIKGFHKQKWQGAKTCNLAIWKEDFIKINGFNEDFQGWGHEDAELVVRLLNSGIQRKEGRFAVTVLHLWHPQAARINEAENYRRLEKILRQAETITVHGYSHTI